MGYTKLCIIIVSGLQFVLIFCQILVTILDIFLKRLHITNLQLHTTFITLINIDYHTSKCSFVLYSNSNWLLKKFLCRLTIKFFESNSILLSEVANS